MGAVGDHGGLGIDDAGARVIGVVSTDEGFFFVAEDAIEGAGFGRGFEGGVDCGFGDFLFHLEDEVGEGSVEERDADREAVEATFELGEDHGHGGSRSGGSGDEGVDGGASTAEVLVGGVDDGLGVGEVVQGGEHAVLDAEGFVDDLDDRCNAVGGAAGVGDDVVDGGVVEVIVAAHDDVEDVIFDGSGDDDFFDSGIEVSLQGGSVAELAGAFEDDVDAGPVGLGGVVVCSEGEGFAIDDDMGTIVRNGVAPAAVDGVKLEQVSGGFGRCLSIIDADEFEIGMVKGSAEDKAADSAKSIDGNSSGHGADIPVGGGGWKG